MADLTANDGYIRYIASSSLSYNYDFYIERKEDLKVYVNDSLVTPVSITNEQVEVGGVVTLRDQDVNVADIIVLTRQPEISRVTNFTQNGELNSDLLNQEFDNLSRLIAQNAIDEKRSFRVSKVANAAAVALEIPLPVANRVLGFGNTATALELIAIPSQEGIEGVLLDAETARDQAIAAAQRAENAADITEGQLEAFNAADTALPYVFLTLAEAQLSAIDFPVGKKIYLIERVAGQGGGHVWQKVTTSSVTTNGYNIVQSSALATQAFQLVDDGEKIIAANWGVFPAGTVDINLYKALVAESTASKRYIQFKQGTYDFNGQDVINGSLVRGGDVGQLRVFGAPGGGTIFLNIGSAHYSTILYSRGIKYQDCVQPIYATGVIDDVRIRFNEFQGCRRSVYHNDSAAGSLLKRGICEYNYFHDHQEDDFIGAFLFNRAVSTRNLTIRKNIFDNIKTTITGTNIVALCLVGVDDENAIANNRNIKFNDNTVTRCGNPTLTFPGTPSFGCVIIGLDCEENNNVMYDNHWLEPVYFKGHGCSQIENRLRENQFSGLSMKVVRTTLSTRENIQDNNIITGQCDIRAAVRMFGAGRSINSQVDITTTSNVDNQGGLAFQITRSSSIGKLTITGDFKAPKGIQINTAGDVEIDVTLESETNGVEVIKSIDGNLGLVSVSGRIDCITQAVNINWAEKISFEKGLEITCDRHDGNSVFLYSQQKTDLSGLSLHVTNRGSDANAIATPIGLFARGGGAYNHTTLMGNFTFLTDRNVTNLFQYNADASLLSPNKGMLKMHNSLIDLNGHTCNNLFLASTNLKRFSLKGVEVDGSLSGLALSAAGRTIDRFIVNENDLVLPGDENTVAGLTNGTATASRVSANNLV